jgi:hypothetical protein
MAVDDRYLEPADQHSPEWILAGKCPESADADYESGGQLPESRGGVEPVADHRRRLYIAAKL